MIKRSEPTQLNKTELLQRGWTKKLIQDFLGEPDWTEQNPKYKTAPPTQLFSMKRIKKAERTKKFKTAMEKVTKRRESAEKAIETKTEKTWDIVSSVKIKVPKMSRKKLIDLACDHYNKRHLEREEDFSWQGRSYHWNEAMSSSDESFLFRIAVNYLRHDGTTYEDTLTKTSGRVGANGAYRYLKSTILAEIAKVYPFLAGECERQAKKTY